MIPVSEGFTREFTAQVRSKKEKLRTWKANQEARKTGKGLSGFESLAVASHPLQLINSLLSVIFEFARAREPNNSDCTNCGCVIDAV
jgi:hypothetical protein